MMTLMPQAGAAILLIILTIWLQCVGIAALVAWIKPIVASGKIQQLKPYHSAGLVVRFTVAVISLQGLEVLLWAGAYRWLCFASWESALYFSAGSYSTVGSSGVSLPLRWRLLGPIEGIIGVLMAGLSISVLYAIVTRLAGARIATSTTT
jgi:voltage-gated potassium channel